MTTFPRSIEWKLFLRIHIIVFLLITTFGHIVLLILLLLPTEGVVLIACLKSDA